MNREKTLLMTMLLLFAFGALSVNMGVVSAVPLYPSIAVVPESTIDYINYPPGTEYSVSIQTDYMGEDIWAWQFSLSYNPNVLQIATFDATNTWTGTGVKKVFDTTKAPIVSASEMVYVNNVLQTRNVDYTIDTAVGRITFMIPPSPGAVVKATYTWFGVVNGDIINKSVDPSATYLPGAFDNTLGKLSLTGAYFSYTYPAPPYTMFAAGPLATIIFRVVGSGASDITLGKDTQLRGWDPVTGDYAIIDASAMPDHIGHGYFENGIPVYAPIAAFTWTPVYPVAEGFVTFDASASSDRDGTIESYAWDFGATGTGETVTHAYMVNGTYFVTLTVTDNDGLTGKATATIYVSPKSVTTYLVDLDGRSAWPEHHHFDQSAELSREGDLNNTLYARIINNGTSGVLIRAVFKVYDSSGNLVVELKSMDTWILHPGEKWDVSADFDTVKYGTGKFRVEAKILYDSNGDGIPDKPGTSNRTKVFSFTVLP